MAGYIIRNITIYKYNTELCNDLKIKAVTCYNIVNFNKFSSKNMLLLVLC